jgi:hypothetical protein
MKKKILINANRDKVAEWENAVESVQDKANRLITTFLTFQPWKKITTLKDFISLVTDPIKVMIQVLQANSGVNLQASGGLLPDPSMVAKLFNLDYENYVNIIEGRKVAEGSCKPCNSKVKIIQTGKGVLNLRTFNEYEKYLIWDNGHFLLNETAIDEHKASFEKYISEPQEIAVYNHFYELCRILNLHAKLNYIGSTDLDKFAKLLNGRLLFSFQSGTLSVDEQSLINEIANLNKK